MILRPTQLVSSSAKATAGMRRAFTVMKDAAVNSPRRFDRMAEPFLRSRGDQKIRSQVVGTLRVPSCQIRSLPEPTAHGVCLLQRSFSGFSPADAGQLADGRP